MPDHDFPVLHIDRPLLDADLAYVGDLARLVGSTDTELVGVAASVIGIGHKWDAERFARFPELRVISRMGIGYDNVDLDAARAAGVVVCNGPDSPTVSTAEHAMMLLLAVTKELPTHMASSSWPGRAKSRHVARTRRRNARTRWPWAHRFARCGRRPSVGDERGCT